jgi:short-subunit dehydrogenase
MRMTKAVLPHMRAQGAGRIINISSIGGFAPQPFMAAYIATKYAVEGYSESLDHEVREHGVRVLLVEPANTSTGFGASVVRADSPLPVHAQQQRIFDDVLAASMKYGDDPAIAGKAIVAAATGSNPKLRYPASPRARRISVLRRLTPARVFDKQIRKINRLAGVRHPTLAANGGNAPAASPRLHKPGRPAVR